MLNIDHILKIKVKNTTIALRWLVVIVMVLHALSGYGFDFIFFIGYIISTYLMKYVSKFYIWTRSYDPIFIQELVHIERIENMHEPTKKKTFFQYTPPVKPQLVELTGNKHLVEVVDENGRPIDQIKEDKNCVKIVRITHKIYGEIKYSYNYHYSNGCVVFGDITDENVCVQ